MLTWEYAILHWEVETTGRDTTARSTFRGPEGREVKDWDTRGKAAEDADIAILNHVGSQGWEVVSDRVDSVDAPASEYRRWHQTWLLRRPVPAQE